MKNLFRITCFALLIGYACNINAQVPLLSSHPSASATLFLDFDGHTVTGTSWNSTSPIFCASSGLTADQITEIFNRVAEDYRPFNLNITTDSTAFLAAPVDKRTRAIVTATSDWYPGVGGVSFIGSFTWGDDTPCFIFSAALGNRPKYISEAISHEAGHTLGLYHQATYDQSCNLISSYNTGTGSGEIGWAPIMGVGYYQNLTLWNNGPNPYGCAETQNDLYVITSYNGFGYRVDDYPGTFATASTTTFSNNIFNVNGIIERNTDQDMIKFTIPVDGKFKLNAVPYSVGASNSGSDLDMQVTLYDSTQTTLNLYNPGNTLNLVIDTTLTAGTYYAKIEGKGNEYAPNYASLGSYSLQATFAGNTTPLPLRILELSGKSSGSTHVLGWLIDADEKVVTQAIEQSANGHDYTVLASPSPDIRAYSYTPGTSETIAYRLHVTFDNGKEYYSNTISLRSAGATALKPAVNGNRIADQFLRVNSPEKYSFRVMDVSGRIISTGLLTSGLNTVNTRVVTAGMYFINFTNGKEQWTEKFVKQ